MNKLHQHYLDIAIAAGMSDAQIVKGGRHPKIVGFANGGLLMLPVGGSKPRSRRAIWNTEAFIRRQIRLRFNGS